MRSNKLLYYYRKSREYALGEIQLALNCTVSKSTGKSPLQMLMVCNKSPPRTALIHEYVKLDLLEIRLEAKVRMDELFISLKCFVYFDYC